MLKSLLPHSICFLIFLISCTTTFAQQAPVQNPPPAVEQKIKTPKVKNPVPINPPPKRAIKNNSPNRVAQPNATVQLAVLGLIALAMFFAFFLLYHQKIKPALGFSLFLLSLIIGTLLFLMISGFGIEVLAVAFGMLGTIAGFILGRQSIKAE